MDKFERLKKYYSGRKVFVTGHTGFKGAWLCVLLKELGAKVYGYALKPEGEALFDIPGVAEGVVSTFADIRDFEALKKAFEEASASAVLHLAAQPIVRTSYELPRETYEINVMGTVNLLECVRESGRETSVLNVTTDKVYYNPELADHAFKENEMLDGYDPYSNSKSCSELVTHSYFNAFFKDSNRVKLSTARAGNVIGGGDFAKDRIVPDCFRAFAAGEPVLLRNPLSTRPFQHVLEPLFAYLWIVMAQDTNAALQGWYNVGPDETDAITAGRIAEMFAGEGGDGAGFKDISEPGAPHEASFLKLDNSKLKKTFDISPVWNIEEAVKKTAAWYKIFHEGGDAVALMKDQIDEFFG